MEKLADRVVGVDGAELVDVVAHAVDRNTAHISDLAARVGVLELGHDLTDTDLMWVALDERLSRLEDHQIQLHEAVREALRRL